MLLRKKMWLTLLVATGVPALPVDASDSNIDLYSMSLQELMRLEISTGSLLNKSQAAAPSAVTIIRRDQIEMSGAKNIANLLEQYVPGMMLMTHSEGDKIGLRGLIAAENYKLLLLVNGKNITNMAYEGAILEIDQWEMGDIEKIEIIRGPGSVTYGSGAIAGVINIITKTALVNLPASSLTLARNETYRSNGISLQYAHNEDDLGVYGYLSYRDTKGYEDPDYFQLSPNEPTNIRYVGKRSIDTAGPQDYLADGLERPQIKAHIDIKYGDNFSTWLRYTQSGQTRAFTTQRYEIGTQGNQGGPVNQRSTGTRSLTLSSDYSYAITDVSKFKTSLTLDSQEYIRWDFQNPQFSQKGVENIRDYAFSQDRATGSFFYDHRFNEDLNLVAGYEYTYINVGAPWNKGRDHILLQEGPHIISDIDSSVYLQDLTLNARPNPNNVVEVGSGMRFHTHSQLLEVRYQLAQNQELFYAHRFDAPDITSSMFSPRLALVSTLNSENTLVSTLQRAQRMMPLRAEYLRNRSGENSEHETLDGLELSFTNSSLSDTSINVRGFYNDIHAVGFTGDELELLADVELFGIEFVGTYKLNEMEFSLSHSYLEALNVTMNKNLKNGSDRNNISYADYYYITQSTIPILLESYGDGLNNWSKNTTKLLFTRKFMQQRLAVHINAQIFWDLDGSYDEMRMYQSAYASYDTANLSTEDKVKFELQQAEFYRERSLLENKDAFKIDYSVNASLIYIFSETESTSARIKFYVENLLGTKRRYNVSTGSRRYYPERLEFMEDPRVFGVSVNFDFK